MAHHPTWLRRLGRARSAEREDLVFECGVEGLLRELREGREPPEVDAKTDAQLRERLARRPDR